MSADPLRARLTALERLYHLVATLAHPKGDHRQNALEDEAHDIIRELRAALLREPPDYRQGCICSCCDHGEGSDCACECHANGLCAFQMSAARAAAPEEP